MTDWADVLAEKILPNAYLTNEQTLRGRVEIAEALREQRALDKPDVVSSPIWPIACAECGASYSASAYRRLALIEFTGHAMRLLEYRECSGTTSMGIGSVRDACTASLVTQPLLAEVLTRLAEGQS